MHHAFCPLFLSPSFSLSFSLSLFLSFSLRPSLRDFNARVPCFSGSSGVARPMMTFAFG